MKISLESEKSSTIGNEQENLCVDWFLFIKFPHYKGQFSNNFQNYGKDNMCVGRPHLNYSFWYFDFLGNFEFRLSNVYLLGCTIEFR